MLLLRILTARLFTALAARVTTTLWRLNEYLEAILRLLPRPLSSDILQRFFQRHHCVKFSMN
jgi:hypothetical protein